jgi:Protein of unknown function (DUF3829)
VIRRNVVLVLVVSIIGCDPKKIPSKKSDDSSENQAILEKLQGYVGCLRDNSSNVFEVADLYTRRFDGKPPAEGASVPLFPTSDPRSCLEAIADVRTLPPDLPDLVAAGDAFGKAVKAVFDLTTEGHRHFDRSAPASFNPARGIALHPRLVTAFADFDAAQGRLFDEVTRLNRRIHADQLLHREQRDGRTLEVTSDNLLYQAEGLARFAATRWDQLDKIDVSAFSEQLEAYDYTIEEMAGRIRADVKGAENYKSQLNQARAYQTVIKQLFKRSHDNIGFTEAEKIMIAADNEKAVVGTPAAALAAYNALVSW